MEDTILLLSKGIAAATIQAVLQGDRYATKLLCFAGIILTAHYMKLEFATDSNIERMLAELKELAAAEAAKERSN